MSVIITTYNRRTALLASLTGLGKQTVPGDSYEILVVDDGSTDGTFEAAQEIRLPCPVRVFRQDVNRGISASRNVAIRNASGQYVIFVSDDLIVPEDFIARHVETLRSFHGFWVVGGLQQLPSLRSTPFGRYLDDLEQAFVEARKLQPIGPDVWELGWPTARNLSLPRRDLEKIGLFDERFRVACEDQDLTHRARQHGIRFLYDARITCVHNDQVGDLRRYCLAQRPRTRDTVLFCAKYPDIHGKAPVAIVNGYVKWADRADVTAKKIVKLALSRDPVLTWLERLVSLGEGWGVPELVLRRMYRFLIGLNMFRGWREGLELLAQEGNA